MYVCQGSFLRGGKGGSASSKKCMKNNLYYKNKATHTLCITSFMLTVCVALLAFISSLTCGAPAVAFNTSVTHEMTALLF